MISSNFDRPSTGSGKPTGETETGLTEAAAEVGDTSDLAESERLEEDRAARLAEHEPDLPDRAFDRITPQV